MAVLRDILVNLFAGLLADLSSPHGMIGIFISLGLAAYVIVGWHRKRIVKGKRGVDSWYFIATAFVVALAAMGVAAYGVGLRSTATISSPAGPAILRPPLNPETDVAFGPYQPEEIRVMILALGQMQDVTEKEIRPTIADIQKVLFDWSEQYEKDPLAYSQKLLTLGSQVDSTLRDLHKVVFIENVRFQDELRPTIEDPGNSFNILQSSLKDMLDNCNLLKDVFRQVQYKPIIGKEAGRVENAARTYQIWVTSALQHIATKTKNLRSKL